MKKIRKIRILDLWKWVGQYLVSYRFKDRFIVNVFIATFHVEIYYHTTGD